MDQPWPEMAIPRFSKLHVPSLEQGSHVHKFFNKNFKKSINDGNTYPIGRDVSKGDHIMC